MTNESRVVTSNQNGVHPDLERIHRRHANAPFLRQIGDHSRQAFDVVAAWLNERKRPIILDSGCGTGMSTLILAARYPDSDVIGVDRSKVRLGKAATDPPENAILIRADLVDFWRLARASQWRLQRHYILYPNPYPKSDQVKKRWHAHPVFADLLSLGGQLELRSNWETYVREFAVVLAFRGFVEPNVVAFEPTQEMTLFERKYRQSGQQLWRLLVRLQCSGELQDSRPLRI